MRGTIECAVLMVPGHEGWLPNFLEDWKARQIRRPAQETIVLHPVYLHDDIRISDPGRDTLRDMSNNALERRALALRRFDACLLPVSMRTLAWTRTALAVAGEELQTPVLGLVKDVGAPGLNDLLAFGLNDFMCHPFGPDEFKSRLEKLVMATRGAPAVQEAAAPYGSDDWPPRYTREPFQAAKGKLVADFERHYICDQLRLHRGNITEAARASNKNRRAFWQLMHKHGIKADPYRPARASSRQRKRQGSPE